MSSHYYLRDGSLVPPWTKGAYPSPSTILDVISNPGIEAYRNMVGTEKADEHMLRAQLRGTRVHKACELWAIYHVTGDVRGLEARELAGNEALLEDGDWPYLDGFIKWWETYNPELITTEQFLVNRKLRYAGTCDLIVRIDDALWLIDIKTGATRPKHGLQIKFYQEAWRDTQRWLGFKPEPMRMAGLYLDASRACGYRYSRSPFGLLEYTESLAAIKAHLAVFKWWSKKEPAKAPKLTEVWAPEDLAYAV